MKVFGLVLMAANAVSAFAGGWDTGGGMAVMYSPTKARFADLVHPSELPEKPVGDEELMSAYFEGDNGQTTQFAGYVQRQEFWSLISGVLTINAQEFPVLRRLRDELLKNGPEPILIESRIHYNEENWEKYASPSLAREYQEPLAAYIEGWLLLSGPVFSGMLRSDVSSDLKALVVHEGLRQLNYLELLRAPLTTAEIEVATRLILDRSFPEDQVDPVKKKLLDTATSETDLDHKRMELAKRIKKLEARLAKHRQLETEYESANFIKKFQLRLKGQTAKEDAFWIHSKLFDLRAEDFDASYGKTQLDNKSFRRGMRSMDGRFFNDLATQRMKAPYDLRRLSQLDINEVIHEVEAKAASR